MGSTTLAFACAAAVVFYLVAFAWTRRHRFGRAAKVGRMGGAAPASVARMVANPGPGRPLPTGLRARVERV